MRRGEETLYEQRTLAQVICRGWRKLYLESQIWDSCLGIMAAPLVREGLNLTLYCKLYSLNGIFR